MKKTITALTLAVMLAAQAFLACAAGSISSSVEKDMAGDQLIQQVTIRGNIGTAEVSYVSLTVKKSDGTVVVLEQGETDGEGNFSFTFEMTGMTGEFTAYVNSYIGQELLQTDLKLLSQQEYQAIIDLFNAPDATAEDYSGYLDTYRVELGLDTKYYDVPSEEIKQAILAKMLKHKGQYTLNNINTLFDQSILFAYFNDTEEYETIREMMVYYDSILNLSDTDAHGTLYQSYTELPEGIQNNVLKKIGDMGLENVEGIREAFFEQTALTAFYELDNTALDAFILKNLDYMGFEGYDSLKQVRKWEILSSMKKASEADDMEELRDIYSESSAAPVETPNPTRNPGTGSSISGGGSGTVYGKPSATPAPTATQKPAVGPDEVFSDLGGVQWAREAILNLYQKGIVSGKEEGKFFPEDAITRGEFAKLIVCAFDCYDENAQNQFSDTDGKWYAAYAASAAQNDLVSGFEDGTFRGDDNITREDMAVILYRALVMKQVIGKVDTLENPFTDLDQVSGYAVNSVLMLANMNLLSGMEDGSFAPKSQATRAEVCTLLYRALEGGEAE